MKKRYSVEYFTGAGDFEYYGTLEEVLEKADNGISYTQKDVRIISDDGETILRFWIPVEYDEFEGFTLEEEKEIIFFGKFGYYTPWRGI